MIGVFDSGHGGLTVLRALVDAAPDRPFVYLGDHGKAPYGLRSEEDVYELTRRGVDALFARGCRLVVVACNTAAAVALRRMQRTWLPTAWPGRNVLGVLVPMVEAITRVPWMVEAPPVPPLDEPAGPPRTVAVFATPLTVASGSFPREIAKRAPDVRVLQQPCNDLAGMIERGATADEMAPRVAGYVAELLAQLDGVPLDTVVLGCTHYPLVAPLFTRALPPGVEVLCQPTLTARSLENYLERHPEYAPGPAEAGQGPVFLTTGPVETVSRLAGRFFGHPTPFASLGS
ncbi:glutamate racemase [Azospirillum fermentarium]|uniref:glutamate racemase n=1 Tax=Azospirillum fermentarium TaxID=1233114 RepID=UPI002226C2DF|nr:aspartate/glutamate racemase family protein [Azospirillum fermentarium]MCW2247192.1 glutamate racemase [Azospirillum fermentarium]